MSFDLKAMESPKLSYEQEWAPFFTPKDSASLSFTPSSTRMGGDYVRTLQVRYHAFHVDCMGCISVKSPLDAGHSCRERNEEAGTLLLLLAGVVVIG
jgi:hypothetical protein